MLSSQIGMETRVWHFKLLQITSAYPCVSRRRDVILPFDVSNDQQLLEVEDLCDSAHPDERSVMTYIASFFHAFSTMGAFPFSPW